MGWGNTATQPTPAGETFAETPDYTQFKVLIFKKTGIDLNQYKQQQMHRRLLGMVERANKRTFLEYYEVLDRDEQEIAAFLDRMTINVSELFRNPEKWEEIRTVILPPILAKKRDLKVWSAGCSYGAEPYSLAILLDQIAPGGKHVIHAGDLDQKILGKAKEALFTDADVKNVRKAVLDRYFDRIEATGPAMVPNLGPTLRVKSEIRSRVSFRRQNLLADAFESDYDLVCCRNVVIYFTDDAKDKLYARFYKALTPGGVLFVGGTERIFNYRELGFESPIPFFYRRIDRR